jgi:hypothetical protein
MKTLSNIQNKERIKLILKQLHTIHLLQSSYEKQNNLV